jgi:excisionase family DNA binding protein
LEKGKSKLTIAEVQLLTPTEAAKLLRVSRSKVYTLISLGVLPVTKITGSLRIPAGALDAFVQQNTVWPGR